MQTLFGKSQRCCCWKWKWSSISQMKATKSILNFNVLHIYHMPQGTMDSLEVILLCIQIFWSFAVIFSICEFGERFNEIDDIYDQFAWYLLPHDVQHMLSTLIFVAQKSIELRVFGNISCGQITLRNVSKTQI